MKVGTAEGGYIKKKNSLKFFKLLLMVYFTILDLGNYNYLRTNGFF